METILERVLSPLVVFLIGIIIGGLTIGMLLTHGIL